MMWYISKIRLCPIILGHICRWIILNLTDFMISQCAGTPQFVILQVEENVDDVVYQENGFFSSHFRPNM